MPFWIVNFPLRVPDGTRISEFWLNGVALFSDPVFQRLYLPFAVSILQFSAIRLCFDLISSRVFDIVGYRVAGKVSKAFGKMASAHRRYTTEETLDYLDKDFIYQRGREFRYRKIWWSQRRRFTVFCIGRVSFCILDTDLRDFEKPCKPHKFCNVRIMVMHVLLSIFL